MRFKIFKKLWGLGLIIALINLVMTFIFLYTTRHQAALLTLNSLQAIQTARFISAFCALFYWGNLLKTRIAIRDLALSKGKEKG